MILGDANRYSRFAAVAVVLFLLFDFAALALNIWLSNKIEQQAVGINLAGRQRMLSQRMAKVLLRLDVVRHIDASAQASLAELKLTFDLFDNTLKGFAEGHKTRGGANEELFLEPVKGEEAMRIVERAMAIWRPYRALVFEVIKAEKGGLDLTLPPAANYAVEHNIELLELMNRLTTELEHLTHRDAERIKLYQGLAFLLALANFFGAFVLYSRRIRDARKRQGLLDDILNKVSACVLVVAEDGATIVMANRTAEQMFRFDRNGLAGKRLDQLITGKEGNLVGHRNDGTSFLATTERNEAFLADRKLFIATVLDVTQQRMTEEHLSSLAYHDLLTRLPNRLLFDDRIRAEVAHAKRKGLMFGLLFIDLDHFKPINDIHGHETGDRLLQDVAVRLKRCLRESDTISRRGGDEFTAIVTDIGSWENCAKVAQVIISQLDKPFMVSDVELRVGASVGISVYPADGEDPHLLISNADEAMYRAKQLGRGGYCFFSTSPASIRPGDDT